ncbi:MAG: hypothetical protein AAF517_10625 [Planctomycetota bacterium]
MAKRKSRGKRLVLVSTLVGVAVLSIVAGLRAEQIRDWYTLQRLAGSWHLQNANSTWEMRAEAVDFGPGDEITIFRSGRLVVVGSDVEGIVSVQGNSMDVRWPAEGVRRSYDFELTAEELMLTSPSCKSKFGAGWRPPGVSKPIISVPFVY